MLVDVDEVLGPGFVGVCFFEDLFFVTFFDVDLEGLGGVDFLGLLGGE